MATNDSNNDTAEAVTPKTPVFREFVAYPPGTDLARLPGLPVMIFADRVRQVAEGARLVGQLRLRDSISKDIEENPTLLMSPCEMSALETMANSALSMLTEEADRLMAWAHLHYTPEGRAVRAGDERLDASMARAGH